MTTDVVPCPFCAEEMPYLVPKTILGMKYWSMLCGTCGAYGPYHEDPEEAVRMWNQRDRVRCTACRKLIEGEALSDSFGNGHYCEKCYNIKFGGRE